jgi:GalNAc-alpha-(1->4)-GalNAc-alpha-(1->3)-diNAcBac-PP-undecaprenol alpha-1,4-N-acetyl-D-galactosaminyltransferase
MPEPLRESAEKRRTADLCIALLIHSLRGGGAERLMSELANRWSRSHRVHLITWAPADQDQYALVDSVTRWGLGLQSDSRGPVGGFLANRQRMVRLRETLQQIAPELIVSFCDQMNIVALEAARGLPTVPVWIAEHSDPREQRLSRLWELWRARSYPRCTGAVVLTEEIASTMTRWVPRDRISVIPPALADAGDSAAKPHDGKDEDRTILYLGRLSPEKRVDLLLTAWQGLHHRLHDWRLRIVGDGPLRGQLERQAVELPRVEFVGWSAEPHHHLQSSDLFVLCSRYEGFPLALLEAFRHGLPSIATRCTSAIDQLSTVVSEEALVSIPVNSAEALTAAILQLAQDPDRRQRMSTAARQVAAHYTWQQIGPLWDRLLA